ncbi:acyltransferase family protein [Paracoccus aminophilus]|uniref:acyltransferase family protein n=1 Tax=Paracoccus aminophilus TaxID=34003 RepID=UPI00041A72FF|nr:acyltransferase family protein [Paracoccus aminophilus]
MVRIYSIDYLKFVMALLVALGHSGLLQNHLGLEVFVFANSLLRLIVPSFAIASGFFLFHVVAKRKLGLWMRRVLMLHVLWTVFYAPIWLNYVTKPRDLLAPFIWGYMQLWFLAGMVVAGVMFAGLLWLGKRLGGATRLLVLVAVLCAIAGVVLQYVNITGLADMPMHRYRNGPFIIFPFMVMGYVLAGVVKNRGLEALPGPRLILPLSLLALLAMVAEASWVALNYGLSERSYLEVPFFSYLGAGLLFVLTLRLKLPKPVLDLGYLSGSIYFLHVFFELVAGWSGVSNEWLVLLAGIVGPIIVGLAYLRLMAVLRPGRKRQDETGGDIRQPAGS